MRILKDGPGRWAVPAVLAGLLAAVLLVTPVIAGSNGVTAKKVNKTIAKKTNVSQLNIAGPANLGTGLSVLGTLSLSQGAYDVRSTFDVRQNTVGANIVCYLRIPLLHRWHSGVRGIQLMVSLLLRLDVDAAKQEPMSSAQTVAMA
jgi:hypothetical protein